MIHLQKDVVNKTKAVIECGTLKFSGSIKLQNQSFLHPVVSNVMFALW